MAQKFSTCVTGMLGRRSATESGVPPLPTCCSSMAVENHAAWIWFVSTPASCMRLEIGLDDQILGAHVPALAEFRAAHAENGDFVPDAGCHAYSPNVDCAVI